MKDHINKEEMKPTISCNALAGITTPQTIQIEINPAISYKALEEITTPQTLKIEGHIKKKKVQVMKDHIENQQQVLQLLKDNATLVQNRMKQRVDQHCSEKCFDVDDWVFLLLHLKQAIYENEMLAILHAFNKW